MEIYLGNRDGADGFETEPDGKGEVVVKRNAAGDPIARKLKGKQRTHVSLPDDQPIGELFMTIIHPAQGVWSQHTVSGLSPKVDTKPPAWVSGDNKAMVEMLAAHYGCEVRPYLPLGERGEFDFSDKPASKKTSAAAARRPGVITSTLMLMSLGFIAFLATRLDLRTNVGADFPASQMGNAAATGAGTGVSRAADYMALSSSATAASASDTTLASEITTGGGGLIRKQATYAHTTSATTYTLTATFTANGSDSLPVTVKKVGIFNASSAGIMVFEVVATDAVFSAVSDQVTYTETVTM